jgi:hypothetical protein
MKMTYTALVAMNLIKREAIPGDVITLTIRNGESDEGMFKQAKRLSNMFLACYHFWPQSIAIHPDHLDLIRKQGKSLDITFSDLKSSLIGKFIDLTELPTHIPLVADPTLDMITAVARFDFKTEEMEDYLAESFAYLLKED